MTPLEISRENARREREARRAQRQPLPQRAPAPDHHKAKLQAVRDRCEEKGKKR